MRNAHCATQSTRTTPWSCTPSGSPTRIGHSVRNVKTQQNMRNNTVATARRYLGCGEPFLPCFRNTAPRSNRCSKWSGESVWGRETIGEGGRPKPGSVCACDTPKPGGGNNKQGQAATQDAARCTRTQSLSFTQTHTMTQAHRTQAHTRGRVTLVLPLLQSLPHAAILRSPLRLPLPLSLPQPVCGKHVLHLRQLPPPRPLR